MKQSLIITSLNIRSLPDRILMSSAAIIAVGAVVAVLLGFLSMARGFEKTVSGSGSENVAVITRDGSESEINSVISNEGLALVRVAPGIARDANNQPLVSGELYVIVDGIKKDSGTDANIPLRGIDTVGLSLRDNVSIAEGRMFQPGKNEIIVGAGIVDKFAGFELGRQIKLGTTTWEVVGVFSSGGSVFESELWADARVVQTQFRRESSVQSIRARLAVKGDVSVLQAAFDADPRLNLLARTELQYFADQSQELNYIVYFGWGLSMLMALGALAGALNTMYASVDARARDIATLRTIGFSGFATFMGTIAESLFLAAFGGVVGVIGAWSFFDGLTSTTLGSSFSQVVFKFSVTPDLMASAMVIALSVGLFGGFFPALRASRMGLARAFRG